MINNRSKKLYICSTHYHLLIVALKQMKSDTLFDVMITHYIPNGKNIAYNCIKSDLFNNVFYQDIVEKYNPSSFWDKLFNLHSKNLQYIKSQLDTDILQYEDIYIFHDGTWMGLYLKDAKKPYHLIEDSLNSYQTLRFSAFSYLLMDTWPKWKLFLKRLFNIGYFFLNHCPLIKSIEVNDARFLHLSSSEIVFEVPRNSLFLNISQEQKNTLFKMFSFNSGDYSMLNEANAVIYLSQALLEDGFVSDDSAPIVIVQIIKDFYINADETLIIKPHPREKTNYSHYFPNAFIMPPNIPIELLFFLDFTVKKTISLFSSVGNNLTFSEQNIQLLNNKSSWKAQLKDFIKKHISREK